jgi:hypothetical protein
MLNEINQDAVTIAAKAWPARRWGSAIGAPPDYQVVL